MQVEKEKMMMNSILYLVMQERKITGYYKIDTY